MTDTATAAPVSSTTVLDALLAELGAVALDNAQLSKDPKKCSHYHFLGPVDDHTRRLMLLVDQKIVALNTLKMAAEADGEQVVAERNAEYDAADDDAKQKLGDEIQAKLDGIVARFDEVSAPQRRQISILQGLLQLEVERQYPGVVGKERVIVNQDCTVGYIDHSEMRRKAMENLEASGFGLIGEIIGAGHLFGRGHFGVPAGH